MSCFGPTSAMMHGTSFEKKAQNSGFCYCTLGFQCQNDSDSLKVCCSPSEDRMAGNCLLHAASNSHPSNS